MFVYTTVDDKIIKYYHRSGSLDVMIIVAADNIKIKIILPVRIPLTNKIKHNYIYYFSRHKQVFFGLWCEMRACIS
jgi:hypothetical protein